MSRISVPLDIFFLLVDYWLNEEVSKDDGYKINKYLEDQRLKK